MLNPILQIDSAKDHPTSLIGTLVQKSTSWSNNRTLACLDFSFLLFRAWLLRTCSSLSVSNTHYSFKQPAFTVTSSHFSLKQSYYANNLVSHDMVTRTSRRSMLGLFHVHYLGVLCSWCWKACWQDVKLVTINLQFCCIQLDSSVTYHPMILMLAFPWSNCNDV